MQNFVKRGIELDLNWLQSVIFGCISGLMDILPVSAQAHRVLLLKFFGVSAVSPLMMLFVHLGISAALYGVCRGHLVRMSRAKRLSRVPKNKRKRPLDVKSLMDRSMLITMLIPVLLAFFLRSYTRDLDRNLLLLALFLLINGIILYAPQFFPTGNRDSRNSSRVEGLLMGLGGAASIVPGISAMGSMFSVGSVCGIDKNYRLDMALLVNMFLNLGLAVAEVMDIAQSSLSGLSFLILLRYILTGLFAFGAATVGIRALRQLTENYGWNYFGLYCIGLSMFTFILNLLA